MNKFELIENIRELNHTASVEFLSQFSEMELQEYIDHLLAVDLTCLTAVGAVTVPQPN
jgi:hypothetical protein